MAYLFIFFRVEENEPKEDARVPLHPVRRRSDRRAAELASFKQAAALYPSVSPMLGAGQREVDVAFCGQDPLCSAEIGLSYSL
jgi:hypothetical protein